MVNAPEETKDLGRPFLVSAAQALPGKAMFGV